METRANYIAIGSVVLITILAAFIFIWWLAISGEGEARKTLRVVFPGAVTGLEVGGQVFFNGIRVGEVTGLTFADNDPTRVVATTAIKANTPLRADTKASLGFSGLTGVAYVELVGGSKEKPALLNTETNPQLVADRSGFQDLMQGARDVLSKADQSLTTINDLIDENRPAVGKSIDNITQFTDALASNSGGVGDFMASLSDATKAFTTLSGRLEGLVQRAEEVVLAVDPAKVAHFVDNVSNASDKLDSALSRVDEVAGDAKKVTGELARFSEGLNAELEKVDGIIGAVDRDKIANIVASVETITGRLSAKADEFDQLIADAQAAASSIRQTSDAVASRSERIAKFIDDAGTVADQLTGLAGDAKGMIADAGKVVKSIDTNKIGDIVASVDTFTKGIAGQTTTIEEAIADARGAAADVQAFTKDIRERQPDINRVISDARNISGKLDTASAKVNDILTKVDGYVEGDGKGLIAEATAAARSIRQIADSFQSRAEPIADGFARFSNRGLRDMETLIEQARQTLIEIQRVFANFDRNPSRVIYGGENVPVYEGGRKRR